MFRNGVYFITATCIQNDRSFVDTDFLNLIYSLFQTITLFTTSSKLNLTCGLKHLTVSLEIKTNFFFNLQISKL